MTTHANSMGKQVQKIMLAHHPKPISIHEIYLNTSQYTQRQVINSLQRLIINKQVVYVGGQYKLTEKATQILGLSNMTSIAAAPRINLFAAIYKPQFSAPARVGAMDAYAIKSKGF